MSDTGVRSSRVAGPAVAARVGAYALAAVLVCVLGACGQNTAPETAPSRDASPVVATVGDLTIDAGDLRAGVERLMGDERELGDLSVAERRRVLGTLIDARLVALEAQRRGLQARASVRAQIHTAEREAVNEVMLQREVEERLAIGPEDVQEQYELWGSGEVVEPAHILVPTREAADSVLAVVEAGADFGELARQRSTHGGSSQRNGSMGSLRKFLIPDTIRERIWDLPAGAVYPEPIRTMMGFHVVKVLSRGHQSLEQQEKAIRGFLGRKRRAILKRDLFAHLQAKYGYEWRGDAVARLIREGPEAPVDAAVARWQGGELTVAGYRSRASGPDASSTDTSRVHKIVDELAAEDLILLEGRNRGWDQLPEVRGRIEEVRLRSLGEALFQSVKESNAATEEEVRSFYESHRQSYRGPVRISVQEILVGDASTADSLYALILEGADMGELARRHSTREETRDAGGIWENVEQYGRGTATVYRLAAANEGLLKPVQLPTGGHSIIRVLSKEPGLPWPLQEVEEAVRGDLLTVAMDALISDLRRQHRSQVEVDEQALSQAR